MIDVLMPASGRPFLDLIFTGLDHMPVPGEEVYAEHLAMVPGGALSAAFVMHRLGLRVVIETTLGCDLGSRFLLEAMEEEGLSREAVAIDATRQASVTVAYNHGGDRSFLSYSMELPPPDPSLVERFRPRAVLLAGLRAVESIPEILRSAKKFGALRLADAQEQPLTMENEGLRAVLSQLDVLICNEREAMHLTDTVPSEEAARLLSAVVPFVVMKRGEKGSLAFWSYGEESLPALEIPVVDRTGCGDNFTGAFTAAMLEGCLINECLAWGNVAGALAAAAPGGTSHRLTRADLLARVAQHYGSSLAPDPLRLYDLEDGGN